MTPQPFTAGDYFFAAELETGVPFARLLATVPRGRLRLALYAPFRKVDGTLVHPSLSEQAAALAANLAASRLLPASNGDVAVMSMVAFLALNGYGCRIAREHARAVELVERVVRSELRERDLAAWVAERIFPDASGVEEAPE
jgi:death-on-curing protein